MTKAEGGTRTLALTESGKQQVENALTERGWTLKTLEAETVLGEATVKKFSSRGGIRPDNFQTLAAALGLDWRELAGYAPLKQEEKVIALTIAADIKEADVQKVESIIRVLRQIAGDSIFVDFTEPGSIRLILGGSGEDLARLQNLIDSGELTELAGGKIASFEEIDPGSITGQKARLIREIRANQGEKTSSLSFSGANLRGAFLSLANLSLANLRDADLSRADLSRADLSRADLSRADLSDADLSDANLISAWLSGANLSGANLSGADLSGADLRGADLIDADLIDANLSGANLSGANLSGANLSGAKIILTDLRDANLSRANLRDANLSRASLRDASLRDANLSFANLRDANLSRADLSGADLSRAKIIKGAILTGSQGLSQTAITNLKSRGAIFEDTPGDRSADYSPRPRVPR